MISDDLGGSLHDRATRGLPLTDEERQQLDAWYEKNNREEAEMLRRNRKPEAQQEFWQAKIETLEKLLFTLIKQNELLAARNDALREDIRALRLIWESRTATQSVG